MTKLLKDEEISIKLTKKEDETTPTLMPFELSVQKNLQTFLPSTVSMLLFAGIDQCPFDTRNIF